MSNGATNGFKDVAYDPKDDVNNGGNENNAPFCNISKFTYPSNNVNIGAKSEDAFGSSTVGDAIMQSGTGNQNIISASQLAETTKLCTKGGGLSLVEQNQGNCNNNNFGDSEINNETFGDNEINCGRYEDDNPF